MAFLLTLSMPFAGCAGGIYPWGSHDAPTKQPATESKATSTAPPKSSGRPAETESVEQAVSTLEQVAALDPVEREKLIADLKQVDASLQPMLLKVLLAEAAYKRREEQRETEKRKLPSAEDVLRDPLDLTPSSSPRRRGGRANAEVAARENPTLTPCPSPGTDRRLVGRGELATPPLQETRFDLKSRAEQDSAGVNKPDLTATASTTLAHASSLGNPSNGLSLSEEHAPGTNVEFRLSELAQQHLAKTEKQDPLAPQPSSLGFVEDRPGRSPEPGTSGSDSAGTAAAVKAEKASEPGPAQAETPSTAARLAAIRREASAGAVVPVGLTTAAAAPISASDWQNHLTAAIRSIELQSKAGSNGESDVALQARLRMLYLLAGRRDDALRPLPAAPQATRDYWTSQIYGLSTWMDAEKTPDTGRRAAETKRILGEALAQLGETAPLAVRNLTFCTDVFRFGSFEPVKSTEFTAGQKVLLYAEIDNLHVESSTKGYHWSVKVNGQIFNGGGNRMADYGSTSSEEYYQTPRHDFFISKLYYLPRLLPGRYTLQLTVEDALGHKVGQSPIDFTVKP